jgi:PAS domain S-box-containing protein
VTPFAGLASIFDRQRASQAIGFAAVAIAVAALVGRWTDLPLLSGWGAGLPVMTRFAAGCLAALGLALIRPGDPVLALAAGLAAAAVAVVNLALALLGGEGHGVTPEIAATAVSLMSPPAALSLILAGSALVLSGFERHDLMATVLAGIAGAVAVLVLLGYLTGINRLHILTSIGAPALPTATALLCIACGIILRIGARPALQRPRPLWHLLAVLGAAIVVPLLLFGTYAGSRMADAQFEQVRVEMMDEARTLSADVEGEITGELETLEALAASPSLRQGDFAAFQRQAEAPLTLRPSGNIVLFDRSARQIVNTSAPFGTPMPEAVIREQVEKAFATGRTQVTGLFKGPVAKDILFSIIMPVMIDGEFRYALVRSPSQHALGRVVAANQLPPGRTALVLDAAHRIIAESGQDTATSVGEELPQSRWPHSRSGGILEFTDSDGRPSLQAYMQSDLTGWWAAISAPEAALGAPLRPLWRTLGWMAVLAFTLVVPLALWVGRIIAGSVGEAARAAVAVGEGHPLPPSDTPVAEVNTLMEELRQTAAKRRAAEDFLRESEWRLQLALAAAQLGSWQHDLVRRVLSGDARAKELFDFAGDEIATEELMARVHPEDADMVSTTFEKSLGRDPKRSVIEFRLQRRNGEYRWLETLGLAHFEGSGDERRALSVVGTVADITARKELEEERMARAEKEHLLMREMSHRAKNMLSVVDAIAHQTAAQNPEDFITRFSERIQSLSANQDLLFSSEWKGVEIKGLVHAQLAHFADLIGTRILTEGPRLRLNASSAQAIGLALHELATNAGKYGALSTDTGRIDICWEVGDGVFTMSWTESGGPPVTAPKWRGFGSIVMGVMAERSVGGTVKLDYASAGVKWRLTCLAANALESADLPEAGGT